MSDNESRIEEDLLEEQEELLRLLLEEEGLETSSPGIPRIAREGKLPASFAQQRMWLLDQWYPGNPAYNIVAVLELHGKLERAILERCLHELVGRHESLRTTFQMHDGQLFQVIGSVPISVLAYDDLSGLPAQEQDCILHRLYREESLAPFDLSRGPLLRARLLWLSDREHHLLLNVHHSIADGWSLNLLVQELASLYATFVQGRPSPLPPLPIQYADFAHWQQQWLQGERLERLLDYWRRQLGGVAPLELPTDHPRPPLQTFAGASLDRDLSADLVRQLKTLSQRQQVTLFTLLLASFQVLLARYSGQQDIAVGISVANRTSEEIEHVVGCFVNTLVLRTDLSGNPGFLEALHCVSQVVQEAYAHQDLPFETLVEELHPPRDPGRAPFFQVMVIHQPMALPLTVLDNLTLITRGTERYTAKFDLTLIIVEQEHGLQSILEYNTDLFEADTIQHLLAQWHSLLGAIVADLGPTSQDQAITYVAPRNLLEAKLADTWQQVLRRARVGIYDNFFELGGDSLLGIRMIALARTAGLQLILQQLFRHQTIAELAAVVDAASPIVAEQGAVVGMLPLTSLQTWYLAQVWHNPHRWTMASLTEVARPLEYNLLLQALQHLFKHHDGLRMHFIQEQGQWHAVIVAPGEQVPLDLVDLSDYPEQEQQAIIESQARHFRKRLDLFAGPVIRVVYFNRGPQKLPQLLFACHHIICDAYSQMIFLSDLQTIYQQLEREESVRLPAKTTSLKQWGERLAEYVASDALRHEFESYWRTLPWDHIIPLPVDFPEGKKQDTRGAARHVIATLSQEETTMLLTQVVGVDTTIMDVLLTALMRSFIPWIGNHPLYLDIVEMGREPLFEKIDLSNTVGQMAIGRWLLLSGEGSLEEALHSIKTQIREVPNRGIGQYLLTFLSKDPLIREVIDAISLPEVLFNYVGQTDIGSVEEANSNALFIRQIKADLGPPWDPREMRDRSLHFALGISNGQFWIFCEYGQKVYRQATISALVDRYVDTLRALILEIRANGICTAT